MRKLSKYLFSCLCISGVLSWNSVSVAEDWLGFRGNARDGRSTETGIWKGIPKEGPKLDWICEGLGEGYASVSVAGNMAYSTGNQDGVQAVVAVDTTSGTRLWVTKLTSQVPQHGYEGSRCTPTIDGKNLYVVGSDGQIACLDAADGNIVWQRKFSEWGGTMMSSWGFSESPLVDGDNVICTPGNNSALLVALDKKTGKEVWKTDATKSISENKGKELNDGAGYASIVISNAAGIKQYVTLVGRGVVGVRASDGELLWRYEGVANRTANIPTPVVDGDYVFCSTAYGTGSALLKLSKAGRTGVKAEEVYFRDAKTIQNKQGGMILHEGHIYCGHGDGRGMPLCLNVKTGKPTWGPINGVGSGDSCVIYADGHILYRFQDGTVAVVEANPKKFNVVFKFKPEYQERESWAYPVIANGKLYLREQDKLMCYQLGGN